MFRNRSYRRSYVEAFYNGRIAAQIRALRETRGLSQEALAAKIGTVQSGVSKLENVNYSGWSLKTLRRIARAFDVALQVRFVTYGEALADADDFSKDALVKPAFKDDPTFQATREHTVRSTVAVAGASVGMIDLMMRSHFLMLGNAVIHSDPVKTATPASPANDNLALAS
jgi:transcriptional regulator with XRE-family HTH domain